jgi:hypothetical protein
MRNLLLIALLLSATAAWGLGCDGAGNCYIYAAAAGTGTGASWTNAYTGFGTTAGKVNPASMTRGVTYWIANGAYGVQTFSTAASGTTLITIEGATTASHGPDGTWNNAYAGQATFIGDNFITTNYWTFNGQSRGGNWQSSYTIKFWNQSDGSGAALNISGVTGATLEYVEVEGTGDGFPTNNSTADFCAYATCGIWNDNGIYEGTPDTNLYIGYSWVHNTGNTQFQMNAAPGGAVNNGTTWEYDWISYNHTGQNGGHDEAYSLYASNVLIRYSVLQDIAGSGLITTAGAGQPQMQNWDMYGNLFFWDSTYSTYAQGLYNSTIAWCAANGHTGDCAPSYYLAIDDLGIVAFLGEAMSGHVTFYNNTIAGMYNPAMDVSGAAGDTEALNGNCGNGAPPCGNNGGSICGSGGCPTVEVENNLWVGSGYVYNGSYCSILQTATGGPPATCVNDYNAAWQDSVPSGSNWQTANPPSTHDYNVSGSTTPFVNYSAYTIAGFDLITPDPFLSHAGLTLSSPYNADMLGITRAANGTWDRGALQLSGSVPANSPGPRWMLALDETLISEIYRLGEQ